MAATADLVIRVTTDTAKAAGDLGNVSSSAGRMSAGIKKAALPAAAALAALGAAAFSAANAAAEDAQGAAILATNLRTAANATDAQVAATEAFIDATAKATGVADDQLRPAMSKLALATGDVESSQHLLSNALDISAATGADVETVAKALGKAYNGSATSLKKLVPSLSDAATESGNFNLLMSELADTTGGAMAAAADTTAGKMARMQVAMDEAQEEIGTALLPALSALAGILSTVATAAQNHPKIFMAIAIAIGALAAAILIANVAFAILNVVASPVILVVLAIVAAIALLVAIVVLLWKKSETFRDIVLAVWSGIKAAATAYFEVLKFWFNLIWPIAKSAFEKIKDVALLAVAAIKDKWDEWFPKIKLAFEALRDDGKEAFDKIKEAVGPLITKVKDLYDDQIKPLIDFLAANKDTIAAVFSTALGPLGTLIGMVDTLQSKMGKANATKWPTPGGGPHAAPVTTAPMAAVAAPRVASAGARSTTAAPVVITVNGALDPEAVARQIRRILAGHDRRVGLAT